MGDKTVIFIEHCARPEKAKSAFNRAVAAVKDKSVVVCSNRDKSVFGGFSSCAEVLYAEDLLGREDRLNIDAFVAGSIRSWYMALPAAEGITEYDGIRLGELLEEKAQRLFTSATKALEVTLKIVDRFRPSKIIFIGDEDVFEGLSVFAGDVLNVESRYIKLRRNASFRAYAAKALSYLCDALFATKALRQIPRGIFIDERLYAELQKLDGKGPIYSYLVAHGLRVRRRLAKKAGCFVALPAENYLCMPLISIVLSRCRRKIRKNELLKEIFTYRGKAAWEVFERVIAGFLLRDFPRARRNIKLVEKVYNKLSPRMVVLREAVRMSERAIVFTAKKFGIPTLVIQHGLLAEGGVYDKLCADRIALWGRSGIDWYAAKGNDVSGCVVTGNPGHDAIHDRAVKPIRGDGNTILYLPSYFENPRHLFNAFYSHDLEYEALDEVLRMMDRFPEKRLVIKLHPFDDKCALSRVASRIMGHPNVSATKDDDLIVLTEESSLVITSLFSSAALTAVILGKPLIVLSLHSMDDLVPFVERGVALRARDAGELAEAAESILRDRTIAGGIASRREAFVYDYAHKIDGKSTARVLELIS